MLAELTVKSKEFVYGEDCGWDFLSESLGIEHWRQQNTGEEILLDRIFMMQNGIVEPSSPRLLRMLSADVLPDYLRGYVIKVKTTR